MSRVEVNINPKVLKWAREEAGYDYSEIAEKVKIPIERYKTWEIKGEDIPLSKLKNLANYYKRQLAVFFLTQIPEKLKKPKDYRNLSPDKSKLSKDILLIMRDVNYFREVALELNGIDYWKERYIWMNEIENLKEEDLSNWLREKLGVTIDQQLSWKSESEAYRIWRQKVELNLGILIFQFSMDKKEAQGFCFSDSFPYAIVTNSNLPYVNRIFTIFHELAHIIRHHSGICLIDNVSENQTEEFECNSFAGKFLLPKGFLETTDELEMIKSYARHIKVSREVYLRRLYEEERISKVKFFDILARIKATYTTEKKNSGFVPPEVSSRARRGLVFYNLVLNALDENRISYSRASDILGLRINRVINES